MPDARLPLDLADELRMRRWARTHYSPPQDRGLDWHPVVLEEMQLRDREIERGDSIAPALRLVPLFDPLPAPLLSDPPQAIPGWHVGAESLHRTQQQNAIQQSHSSELHFG